jgi:5'-methylthioadenosine phosphorylase
VESRVAVIAGSWLEYPLSTLAPMVTPYGMSCSVGLAEVAGSSAIWLLRHGGDNEYPPHSIPYRANMWALHRLGVRNVFSLGAVGSLRPDWDVADLVVCDQFVNRTWGRADTYLDGPQIAHPVVSEPYCSRQRLLLLESASAAKVPVHDGAVLVVIQGPRYSTRAENRDWRRLGYDVISMTHYPEVVLARELGMCFSSVGVVSDHACVLGDDRTPPASAGHGAVLEATHKALPGLLEVVAGAIRRLPPAYTRCFCPEALAAPAFGAAGKGVPV